MPASAKAAKSWTAAAPTVRSVSLSPRCPPLSCQQPLMTRVMDRSSAMATLGTACAAAVTAAAVAAAAAGVGMAAGAPMHSPIAPAASNADRRLAKLAPSCVSMSSCCCCLCCWLCSDVVVDAAFGSEAANDNLLRPAARNARRGAATPAAAAAVGNRGGTLSIAAGALPWVCAQMRRVRVCMHMFVHMDAGMCACTGVCMSLRRRAKAPEEPGWRDSRPPRQGPVRRLRGGCCQKQGGRWSPLAPAGQVRGSHGWGAVLGRPGWATGGLGISRE
mmetsp:Transcript_334/g.873  ORF Transcript_334/g.873 Transcript_334/m.873 type:complete len:275 (+) Transcript_334:1516-2340(+)